MTPGDPNDIQVKTPGGLDRTDTVIAQTVRRALEWDVFVEHERIQSIVTDGCVTLEGAVDLLSQRDDAERAVRNLTGVITVVNKISVATPPATNENVAHAIERAVARGAERDVRDTRLFGLLILKIVLFLVLFVFLVNALLRS